MLALTVSELLYQMTETISVLLFGITRLISDPCSQPLPQHLSLAFSLASQQVADSLSFAPKPNALTGSLSAPMLKSLQIPPADIGPLAGSKPPTTLQADVSILSL